MDGRMGCGWHSLCFECEGWRKKREKLKNSEPQSVFLGPMPAGVWDPHASWSGQTSTEKNGWVSAVERIVRAWVSSSRSSRLPVSSL